LAIGGVRTEDSTNTERREREINKIKYLIINYKYKVYMTYVIILQLIL
jgi:hypothetical protein